MRVTKTQSLLGTSLATALLLAPSAVMAQDAEEGAEETAGTTGNNIIVTARKKEESILDAPVAITAFGAEELEAADIENLSEVADATPGFYIDAFQFLPGRYDSTPFIRGVVIETDDPTTQIVSVFVDGVYVAGGARSLGVEDVERIEVIKGPQSALFGRTTFAGAINYVTKDPASDFGGSINATVGTRDLYKLNATLEGPIAGDALRGRLTGRFDHKGGHWENTAVPGDKLGEEETWSVGGTLLFEPSSNLSMKLRGYYGQDDDGPAAAFTFNRSFNFRDANGNAIREPFFDANGNPTGATGIEAFRGVLPDPDPALIGANSSDDNLNAFLNALNAVDPFIGTFNGISAAETGFGLRRNVFRISLHTNIVLSDNVELDLIGAHATDDATILFDVDGTPNNLVTAYFARALEDTSFEARLSGTAFNERLQWAFGGNYFNLDSQEAFRYFDRRFVPSGVLLDAFFNGLPDETLVDNISAFGQLEYELTETLSVSLEGRYQVDEIGARQDNGNPVLGAPQKFKKFLPRVTVDFQPTPDTLLYATYSVGNLPGGFNTNFLGLSPERRAALLTVEPNVGETFGEEELINYEIGWKQSFGNTLNFALSAFMMDRKDQQVNTTVRYPNPDFDPLDPTSIEFVSTTLAQNAQSTEIKGFEFEANWRPVDLISMRGTLAYIDSKIESFPDNGDSGELEDVFGEFDSSGNPLNPAGFRAPIFPKWQASLATTISDNLDFDLGGAPAGWYVRSDVFYRGKYFTGTANLGQAPASTVVNLRAGIESNAIGIEAFVTNLTNEDAYTAAATVRDVTNFRDEANQVGLRDKRQFGVRLSYDF